MFGATATNARPCRLRAILALGMLWLASVVADQAAGTRAAIGSRMLPLASSPIPENHQLKKKKIRKKKFIATTKSTKSTKLALQRRKRAYKAFKSGSKSSKSFSSITTSKATKRHRRPNKAPQKPTARTRPTKPPVAATAHPSPVQALPVPTPPPVEDVAFSAQPITVLLPGLP